MYPRINKHSKSIGKSQKQERKHRFHFMGSKRTDLPHVIQKFDWDCGIACIQMIFLKLKQSYDDSAIFDAIKTLGVSDKVWSIDLANILRHFNVDFVYFTITCGVDPGYKYEAFYKDDFSVEEVRINTMFRNADQLGIKIIKRSLSMEEIVAKLDDGHVAIVLVDSNLLKCNSCSHKQSREKSFNYLLTYPISNDNRELTKQYAGHYIVLCGYDTESGVIFCKNPSLIDEECTVNIASFELARKSYGTDEDIIFVNMKQ